MNDFLQIAGLLVTGGLASRLYDKFYMSRKDELVLLVEQLQRNVNANNEKVDKLQQEVDHWKSKFYEELEQKNNLKDEVRRLTHELKKFNTENSKTN